MSDEKRTLPPILADYDLSYPQREAVLARGRDVAVTAGAGTGKTRTLVARYLALLADGLSLRGIVAITFTRKAAREMRNRVRGEIGKYLKRDDLPAAERERWRTFYQELDAARIGTIHNLCGEILRAHPAEGALDPRFGVVDENDAALLTQEAVETALAWAVERTEMAPVFDLLTERALGRLIGQMLSRRLLLREIVAGLPADEIGAHWRAVLGAEQETAVASFLANPDVTAARSFLRRSPAADESDLLAGRQRELLAALDEIDHAPAAEKPRLCGALAGIKTTGGRKNSWPGGEDEREAVREAMRLIVGKAKEMPQLGWQINEQDERLAAAMPGLYAIFQQADQAYTALKEERHDVDFDDLEGRALQLLAEQPAIREYWQGQVRALLVDEFQDTNGRQQQFVRHLCPTPGKLFIVGDAKQSIYRFRGADVTVFAGEKDQIEKTGGALIDLDTSYRAHAALLQGMNQLLAPILGPDSPERPAYKAPFAPLLPAKSDPTAGLTAPFVEFYLGAGNKADGLGLAAQALAARLREFHEELGISYGGMAILCRASSAFQYYEDALDGAGIPYVTVAGKGFYGRPEIRDLLNGLQALADPHDDLALAGLLRSPAIGLSDESLYHLFAPRRESSVWALLQGETAVTLPDADEMARLAWAVELINELSAQVGRISAADLLKRFLDRTRYRAILQQIPLPRALRNVDKLLADIHRSGVVGIDPLLEMIGLLRDSGSREGEARAAESGAVRIMSIHAAKGLEFPIIVLGDAGGGSPGRARPLFDPALGILLPEKDEEGNKGASYQFGEWLANQQEEAEAARLLYVALTRAEQVLLISGHFKVTKRGSFSMGGWLKQLAAETGLLEMDLGDFDMEGAQMHNWEQLVGETAVRAALFEPEYRFDLPAESMKNGGNPVIPPLSALQRPLASAAVEKETTRRVWRVVPVSKRPTAPAWVVGSLVHDALASWRFPDDGFADWVTARAWQFGLSDDDQLADARRESVKLLRRFQESAIYREIAAADWRRHELAYTLSEDGEAQTGKIDLLYRVGERWVLVDFKTDRLSHRAEMVRTLEQGDYPEQVRQYGRAVQQLMGVIPDLRLCFLNVGGAVLVHPVPPAEER